MRRNRISNYIGNAGDGKKWLERLTSNLKMFTVPSLHSIAPARPRLRSLRRGHGNLGLQLHLCLRSEKHLEARATGVLVRNFIVVLRSAVILSKPHCHPERQHADSLANRHAESKDPYSDNRSLSRSGLCSERCQPTPGRREGNRGPSTAL